MSNELIAVIVGIVWLAGIPAVLYLSHKYPIVMELYGIEHWVYVWPATTVLWLSALPFYLLYTYIIKPVITAYQKMHYRMYVLASKSDETFDEFRREIYPTEDEKWEEWKANVIARKEVKSE